MSTSGSECWVVPTATSAFFSTVEDHGQSKSSVHHNHVSPKSSSPSPDISVSQAREVHLLERTLPNGGPIQTTNARGWEIRYRQYFSFIIPVQVAASVLEEFYTSCLRRIALNQFRNNLSSDSPPPTVPRPH